MNFKRFRVSKNLLNQTVPPQNIYITDSIRRMGYEVAVPAGTYTAYGNNADLYAKIKINGVYGGASQINTPLTLTLSSDGSIIIYSRVNGEFPDVNIMLNSGSEALPYEPYSSEVWHDIPHYVHKTSTDTITSLPAVLYPTGTTATVGLKGQTVQSSIPSPTSPIMPQGTGERTENEWNVTLLANSSITSENYWEKYDSSTVTTTMYMPCDSNTTYYLYTPSSITSGIFRVYTSTSDTIPTLGNSIPVYEKTRSSSPISTFKFTTGANDKMLIIQVTTANSQTMADDAILDKGYKIPISSNNTTTNIYLGEVQTTRKIKKLVLTGDENWNNQYGESLFISENLLSQYPFIVQYTALSTEYLYNPIQSGLDAGLSHGEFALQRAIISAERIFYNIGFKNTNYINVTSWKSYLAAQYAAGTPVTVWYVLATEETAVVNEPLMKIGTYADEVSNVSIPVTAGADTISVDTTVQPSEVTVNYKGWHPAIVHERTNGAWD